MEDVLGVLITVTFPIVVVIIGIIISEQKRDIVREKLIYEAEERMKRRREEGPKPR